MAPKPKTTISLTDDERGTALIVIERRYTVGAVFPADAATDDRTALQVAFDICAHEYHGNRNIDRFVTDTLAFTYDGHEFEVKTRPNTQTA